MDANSPAMSELNIVKFMFKLSVLRNSFTNSSLSLQIYLFVTAYILKYCKIHTVANSGKISVE